MKDSYFNGFNIVQNTQDESIELRLMKTNDSSQAIFYENENGEIVICSYNREALLLVHGALLAATSILDKHIKQTEN